MKFEKLGSNFKSFYFFNKRDKIDQLSVCIRIFGDLELIPEDLKITMAKVMDMTKTNKKLV
jgi:hypothetical protein